MKATLKINDEEIEVEITEKELKKLEEKKPRVRWRAGKGDKYWYVSGGATLFNITEDDWEVDKDRYSVGNYFKTKEEAEFHRNELVYTQMLKDYVYEHDVELDWDNARLEKYFLMYDVQTKEIKFCSSYTYKSQGSIYASNKQVLLDAIKFVGEKNVKKYIFKMEK